MAIPHGREPSVAELSGWRRFWDGWVICPPCMSNHGQGYTPQTWRVPQTYDTAIKPTDRCMNCRRTPLEVLVPAFLERRVRELYERFL